MGELLASPIKWKQLSLIVGGWLQGGCEIPHDESPSGQILAYWGSGGRLIGVWGLLQGKAARGEFLFPNRWKKWLLGFAHAALCQNSRALPSSVQIFQEIIVREPRGKKAAATTEQRDLGQRTLLIRALSGQQQNTICKMQGTWKWTQSCLARVDDHPKVFGNHPEKK